MRSQQYRDGKRAALKWAVEWLHKQAKKMDDPKARGIMNRTALELGIAKREYLGRMRQEKQL